MKALTFTRTGNKSTDTSLNKDIFEVEISQDLLKQAVVRSQANLRQSDSKVLTRGEVRGGGKKPWRQKGTGRARFGSSRVNIWRHGGVAHGPTGLQNYQKEMPVKMIKASIKMSLTAQKDCVKVIEKFSVEKPKTQLANKLLDKLQLEGKVLLVTTKPVENFALSVANLPGVRLVSFSQLRAYDVLNANNIVFEKEALQKLNEWLGATK